MAFSDLPPEVLDHVVSYLAVEGKIAKYATVSVVMQQIIENRLFYSLGVSSPDLQAFSKVVESHEHRKKAIRHITLTVVLPSYTDQACGWFESEKDKTANNQAFTAAVKHLFSILSSCDNVDRAQPISLFLGHAYSPTDISQRGQEKLSADKLAVETNERHDLFEHRYEHSYLQLLHSQSLPVVQRVKAINIYTDTSRCLAPATAVNVTSRLPSVEVIEWHLLDPERKYRELRTNLRKEFAEALTSRHWECATSLKLNLVHEAPNNEGFINFDVRPGNETPLDGFSALLGNFLRTSNLVKIELGNPICIGPEVFRLVNQQEPSWPCLEEFFVTVSLVRPDGEWYFDRSATDADEIDDNEAEYVRMAAWRGQDIDADTESSSSGYDSEESFFEDTERPPDHYNESHERYRQGLSPTRGFRTIPSPAFEELLKAAATAVPYMPALRTFAVGADLRPSVRTGYDPQAFEFVFAAAGFDNWMDREADDSQHRRLTWVAPREWRPGPELTDAWKEALGNDAIVRYQEW